jgi:hypothetical protein
MPVSRLMWLTRRLETMSEKERREVDEQMGQTAKAFSDALGAAARSAHAAWSLLRRPLTGDQPSIPSRTA